MYITMNTYLFSEKGLYSTPTTIYIGENNTYTTF
jgi:hypothetical protein